MHLHALPTDRMRTSSPESKSTCCRLIVGHVLCGAGLANVASMSISRSRSCLIAHSDGTGLGHSALVQLHVTKTCTALTLAKPWYRRGISRLLSPDGTNAVTAQAGTCSALSMSPANANSVYNVKTAARHVITLKLQPISYQCVACNQWLDAI